MTRTPLQILWSTALFGVIGLVLSPSVALADMEHAALNHMFLFDELAYGFSEQDPSIGFDSTSWVGGDWNRVWFKAEGEISTVDPALEGEAQMLYSRLISPFWELQTGLRGDLITEDGQSPAGRGHLVLGLEGLAPHWFEVEPTVFLSHRGDVSFRLRATYDLHITQRLVARPSFETNIAIQSVPEFGVGSGFNDIEAGLRLGYQVAREFMPYIGVSWTQALGETADMLSDAGEATGDVQGVVGLSFWF